MQSKHLLLAFFVVFAWGFNIVVIELGLQNIPPLFLVFSRFFLASIPFVFFVKKPKVAWSSIALYGLFMFILQFGLLFLGMNAGVTPALAGILIQSQVFFSVLLGKLFFKEKIHIWQIIGGLVAFAGITLVGIETRGNVSLIGFILVVLSGLAWSCGNSITKRLRHADPLGLVVYGSTIAWPFLLVFSIGYEGLDKITFSIGHFNLLSIGVISYLSYLTVLFNYLVWNFLIKNYSLITIAPFSLCIPIVAMFSSAWVLNEPLPFWKILAALLVVSGLAIDFLGKRLFRRLS